MFGIPGKSKFLALLMAGLLLLAGAGLAFIYLASPHVTLRITTGPTGAQADKFIDAFIKVTEAQHPRIRIEKVQVPDLTAAAKALQDGKVDLAIIRSDTPLPASGEILVNLRHDALAFLTPHHSEISGLPDLSGKTIALVDGATRDDDARVLDILLGFYNIAPTAVKRIFLPPEQIGEAIAQKKAVAAFAVGPLGPGSPATVIASLAAATKGAPKLLSFDDADAIVARFPIFESMDVPQGGLKARPQTPDDDATVPGVRYMFIVPITMPDLVANIIGRSILTAKAQLMAVTPIAAQISAPDVSDTNPLLPIHPGFADYLNNGDQSFFDQAQRYLYLIGIPLSLGASLLTVLISMFNSRKARSERAATARLLTLAQQASEADHEKLAELEHALHEAVASCIQGNQDGDADAQWKTSLAIQHAMRRFERRAAELKPGSAAKAD